MGRSPGAGLAQHRLGHFREGCSACEQLGTTPQEVVKMNQKQAKFFLHDLITHFEKGTRDSRIESYVKAVKSWMIWNDIDLPKNIRIFGRPTTTGTRTMLFTQRIQASVKGDEEFELPTEIGPEFAGGDVGVAEPLRV